MLPPCTQPFALDRITRVLRLMLAKLKVGAGGRVPAVPGACRVVEASVWGAGVLRAIPAERKGGAGVRAGPL